jgi:hypothetical protein
VILPQLTSQNVTFSNIQAAVGAGLQLRLFGKPEIDGSRRLGVTLASPITLRKRWRAPKRRRQRSWSQDKKTRSQTGPLECAKITSRLLPLHEPVW